MPLHVFGLTGGIGSGKSTVSRRLTARGVPVIDADVLAREVVAAGTEGLAEIVRAFGDGVLGPEGGLDREKLARIVFGDDDARRRLNAITHPRVGALAMQRRAEIEARGEPLACYEVPLLFEGRFAEALRPVVVVAVPVEVQIARTMARDTATEDAVRARIRAQMPLDEKVRLADHVIENHGSLETTWARTDEVLDAICARFQIDPTRYPRT